MKIGLMNDPSASVYDEIASIGREQYDFVDLTIEGPKALNPDVKRVSALLDEYGLSVVGHTDPCIPFAYPIDSLRKACFDELERCAGIFSWGRWGYLQRRMHCRWWCLWGRRAAAL